MDWRNAESDNCYARPTAHPGYRLQPLSEVGEYIPEHHHLPGIPSEAAPLLTTGILGYYRLSTACTIIGWYILVNAGTVTVDIRKIGTGTAKPTVANTITGSAKPAISTGTVAESTVLTGWTTTGVTGDWFAFNLDAVSGVRCIQPGVVCR